MTGLLMPTSAAVLPDGRMLVTSLYGTVWITSPLNQPPVTHSVYMQVQNLDNTAEHGLIEVVLDPGFSTNNYFYLYYSTTASKNRVSRFVHLGASANFSSETVIYETPQAYTQCCHIGGALAFANDGTMLLAIGDDFTPAKAQDLSQCYGKVHRFTSTGGIPTDNPYYDATPGIYNANGVLKSIYASGLRNPFRGSYNTLTGEFLIGEVGGNDHTVAWEDLHRLAPAANFGWPFCGDVGRTAGGMCTDPQYDDPVFSYPHAGSGASITDGFTYTGTMFPAVWQGRHFYGDYVRGWIRYLQFDSLGHVTDDQPFVDPAAFGGVTPLSLVKLFQGPDGSLYYITLIDDQVNYTGSIHRIFHTPDQAPECGVVQASPTSGPGPTLTTTLSAVATDPEGEPLSYTWTFGDGSALGNGASVQHTYTGPATFNAQVVVSDGTNTISCGTVPITVGAAPTAQILSPANGSTFQAGDVITFTGLGTDDGPLTQASYAWNVVFNHDQHIHPETGATGTSVFDLMVPTSGHGFNGLTYYTITLTVTDANGLTASQSVQIFPEKVPVTVTSIPPGLEVLVDGLPVVTPYTEQQAIGFSTQIGVYSPQQCQGGTGYTFGAWSDGQPLVHDITVPVAGATLSATFNASGACAYCGRSITFDGTDDLVAFSPFTLSGDWTIEFWLRADPGFSAGDAILGNDSDLSLDLKNGKLRLFKVSERLVSSVNVVANQWNHYAITRTSGTLKLYVNGVLDSMATTSTFNGSTQLTWMGKGVNAGFLGGALDEVRIWSTARTAQQIQQFRGVHVDPTTAGLKAYWRFDVPDASQLIEDLGPEGHDGTRGASLAIEANDPVLSATSGPMQYACTRDVPVQMKVLLQGAMTDTSSWMQDRLRVRGLVPLMEPFTALGFAMSGGSGATTTPAVLAVTGANAVVDWVLVEVRDAWNPGVVRRTVPALVQRDGDVVAQNGQPLNVQVDFPSGYLAVRHRNHLGAMSASPLTLASAAVQLDLTAPATPTYGTDARVEQQGSALLHCGDVVRDGHVKYTGTGNDRDDVLLGLGGNVPTAVVSGYRREDVTLDGDVKYTGAGNDRDAILRTIGGIVVTGVVFEQLP